MVTDCRNCWLRKRPIFLPMTEAELDFMQEFKTGELNVDPGTTLMLEGSNSPQLFTVLDGMGLRYKTLEDGERQVISFVMPGDFIGLQAGVMDQMQHSVESTTSMKLCVFDRRSLWRLFQDHPERAYDLTWIAALEEHFLGEQLAVVGRMPAEQRLARGKQRALGKCGCVRPPMSFRCPFHRCGVVSAGEADKGKNTVTPTGVRASCWGSKVVMLCPSTGPPCPHRGNRTASPSPYGWTKLCPRRRRAWADR